MNVGLARVAPICVGVGVAAALAALLPSASSASALAQEEVRVGRVETRAEASAGWIGIEFVEVREGDTPAMRVRSVHPGSPAHRAGVREGDRVVRVNGAPITRAIMASLGPRIRPGDPFTFHVIRQGTEVEVSLVAEPRPSEGDLVVERLQIHLDTLRIRILQALDTLRLSRGLDTLRLSRGTEEIPALRIRQLAGGDDGRETTFVVTSSLGPEIMVISSGIDSMRHVIDSMRRTVEIGSPWRGASEGAASEGGEAERSPFTEWRVVSPLAPWTEGVDRVAGAELHPVSPELGRYFEVDRGLLVVDVVRGAPAFRAGLRAGDVLVSVDGEGVDSLEGVRRLLTLPSPAHTLQIVREGASQELTLRR